MCSYSYFFGHKRRRNGKLKAWERAHDAAQHLTSRLALSVLQEPPRFTVDAQPSSERGIGLSALFDPEDFDELCCLHVAILADLASMCKSFCGEFLGKPQINCVAFGTLLVNLQRGK